MALNYIIRKTDFSKYLVKNNISISDMTLLGYAEYRGLMYQKGDLRAY
jgi:hypothetical protein